MISRRTVFVLGAGSSTPYSFPLGWQLRQEILALGEEGLNSMSTRFPPGDAHAFLTAFRGSNSTSIDAFLSKRGEFLEIGRAAIATIILGHEQSDFLLQGGDGTDDWLQYLVDQMDAPWDEMRGNNVAFVTFNYDRSLEHYLTNTWMHRFGKSEAEAIDLVEHFPIVHAYGQLGSLKVGKPDYVPFGGGRHPAFQAMAARGLQVIPEGRNSSDSFTTARHLILGADRLAFLGFGFDPTNIARSGGQEIGAGGHMVPGGFTSTEFAATGFGLTQAEVHQAATRIADNQALGTIVGRIIDCRCRELLRKTLIAAPS